MPTRGTTTRLFLVRHGETDDNHAGVFQGQAGKGLNARGVSQAQKLALRIGDLEPHVDIHALYTSDLERAVATADLLSQVLGLAVIVDEGLREVFVGEWQGKTMKDVEALYPEEVAAWRAGLDVARGGGETYAELAARMGEALARIAHAHAGKNVVVVSHGAAIKAYVASLFGNVMNGMRALGTLSNTGVTLLERDRDLGTRLVVWNDVSHLRDPVLTAAKVAVEPPPPPARSSKKALS